MKVQIHFTVVLLALALSSCSAGRVLDRPKPSRAAEPAIPAYPGAQEIQLETFSITNVGTGYVRTFSTVDTPAKVEEFYKRELAALGWRTVVDNLYEETRACPFYSLRLEIERVSDGVAQMRLTWQPEECKNL